MSDYANQVEIARLKRAIADLSSSIISLTASAAGIGRVGTIAELRAATAVTLTYDTILLFSDDYGNPGMFAINSISSAADDGVNTIVDAASRRWIRLGAIV